MSLQEPDKNGQKRLETWLAEALANGSAADKAHFEFEELSRFAEDRRARGEKWEMPAHLSRCPLCLEAFQVILQGVPDAPPRVIERFVNIRNEPPATAPNLVPLPSRRKALLKIAAAVAILLVGVWMVNQFGGRSSAQVSEGVVTLQNGRTLPSGETIPARTTITAVEPVQTGFADGSKVELAKHTRARFHETLAGSTTVALTAGEVVATVAKQERGKSFVVKTPLGVVTVVGTKFRVACHEEDVVVYQSTAGQPDTQRRKDTIRAVRVTVFEGIVQVKRRSEMVLLHANQEAVLRANEPGIEVVGVKP